MKLNQIFAVFTVVAVFSVNISASDFYAGAKIGPGVAFMYGDDVNDDVDPAAGMSLGLFGTYQIIKLVGIQAQLNYELKGFSGKDDNTKARQFMHYFSIPIMAKGFFPVSIVTIQPYFGLNFSFLMNAKMKMESSGTILGDVEIENENTDDFEVFDLGILFGTEAFIKITDHIFITADLRFDLGVLEVVDGKEAFNGTFLALFGAAYKF